MKKEAASWVQGALSALYRKKKKDKKDKEKKAAPSSGLTSAQKSSVVSSARKGKDLGKKGKRFAEIASKAAKRYGSEDAGRRVAASIMWKSRRRG